MADLRLILVNDYNYNNNENQFNVVDLNNNLLSALLAAETLDDDNDNSVDPTDEVTSFFQFTSIPDVGADPLEWWKSAERRFPTIAKMARDYLAIQATSVASESTFSTSGQLITNRRSSLSDDRIEASMLCRNWKRQNFSYN